MLAFVIVLQVVVALFLIMVVLLQPGNRGGASAALGGAGSDTVFGGRGANTFLAKLTFGAAVCFMVTNFALAYWSSSSSDKSVLDLLEATKGEKQVEEGTQNEPAAEKINGEKDVKPSDAADQKDDVTDKAPANSIDGNDGKKVKTDEEK